MNYYKKVAEMLNLEMYERFKLKSSDGDLEIALPSFPNNRMYLGMKMDKNYTLEELGL